MFEPLIPPQKLAVHGRTGRPRVSDRDVLEGIAFVLSTGIGWTKLPAELGYGSGWTCWRRMREWAEAGVFDRVHQTVLDRLGEQGELDPTEVSRSAGDGEGGAAVEVDGEHARQAQQPRLQQLGAVGVGHGVDAQAPAPGASLLGLEAGE